MLYKLGFIVDKNVIIVTRVRVIWSKLLNKKRSSYQEIRDILLEYFNSKNTSIFYNKISNIQENLLYFISYVENQPVPKQQGTSLQDKISFHESNAIYYYL